VSGPDSCPAATGSSAITDCSAATESAAAAGSSAAAAVDLAGREEKLKPGGQLMLLARQSKSLVLGGGFRILIRVQEFFTYSMNLLQLKFLYIIVLFFYIVWVGVRFRSASPYLSTPDPQDHPSAYYVFLIMFSILF
jgi:hypothetical protein